MQENESLKPTELPVQKKKNGKNQAKKPVKSSKISLSWPIKIFFITLILSLILSVASEYILTQTGLIISFAVIFLLLFISVLFDMLGVAVAASELHPFAAMASKRVAGSKEAMYLVKNASKVSSFACDIVGDICGILSGAVGAGIVLKLYSTTQDLKAILIAAVVSSIIAALTVFGKAVGKGLAIAYPEKIVFFASKVMRLFKFSNKK